MAWTTPRTWVTGEVVTAAIMNSSVRDNMNETVPGKASASGDVFYATGANVITRLAKGNAYESLNMNSGATAPAYMASLQSLLTAQGDVVYASSANTPARLAKGSKGQVLEMNDGETAPSWSQNLKYRQYLGFGGK